MLVENDCAMDGGFDNDGACFDDLEQEVETEKDIDEMDIKFNLSRPPKLITDKNKPSENIVITTDLDLDDTYSNDNRSSVTTAPELSPATMIDSYFKNIDLPASDNSDASSSPLKPSMSQESDDTRDDNTYYNLNSTIVEMEGEKSTNQDGYLNAKVFISSL